MRHLMLVMTLLLASIETVKLEDSEDDIEDVRKGREIMEKVKANNLSFQFDLVINRYICWDPFWVTCDANDSLHIYTRYRHYSRLLFKAYTITDNASQFQLYRQDIF